MYIDDIDDIDDKDDMDNIDDSNLDPFNRKFRFSSSYGYGMSKSLGNSIAKAAKSRGFPPTGPVRPSRQVRQPSNRGSHYGTHSRSQSRSRSRSRS